MRLSEWEDIELLQRRLAIEDRILRRLIATFEHVYLQPSEMREAVVTARAVLNVWPAVPCFPGAEMFFGDDLC